MLTESHLDILIAQTFDFKTSETAHLELEKMIIEKCESAKTISYGLT